MVLVQQQLGASERRACRVLGQGRSTQRRKPRVKEDEEALRDDGLHEGVCGKLCKWPWCRFRGLKGKTPWQTSTEFQRRN